MPPPPDPVGNWFEASTTTRLCPLYGEARAVLRDARTDGPYAWLSETTQLPLARANFGLLRDKFPVVAATDKLAASRTDRKLTAQYLHALAKNRVIGCQASLDAAHVALKRIAALYGGAAKPQCLRAEWHFLCGLGLPNYSDFGLLVHPTLNVCYLPAGAVKGLLRHWLIDWYEPPAKRAKLHAERVRRLLGTPEHQGEVIFFDALPLSPVHIMVDTVTPHVGDWSVWTAQDADAPQAVAPDWRAHPAGFHQPVPLAYHAARPLTLSFLLAADLRHGASNRPLTADLRWLRQQLAEALAMLGAGARTQAGYGRFTPATDPG